MLEATRAARDETAATQAAAAGEADAVRALAAERLPAFVDRALVLVRQELDADPGSGP